MNLIAIVSAVIGVALMSLTVVYGNKLKNKWLGYLAAIIGIVVSLVVMGNIPALFGDESIETANLSGTYLGALIVIVVIVKFLFFRKKK